MTTRRLMKDVVIALIPALINTLAERKM